MSKKKWNVVSAVTIAVGVVGFVVTGGTEAGADVVLTCAVALVGAGIALWNAIKG